MTSTAKVHNVLPRPHQPPTTAAILRLFGSIGAGADAKLDPSCAGPPVACWAWIIMKKLGRESINLGLNQASLKVLLSSHSYLTLHFSLYIFSTLTLKRVLWPLLLLFQAHICRSILLNFVPAPAIEDEVHRPLPTGLRHHSVRPFSFLHSRGVIARIHGGLSHRRCKRSSSNPAILNLLTIIS